MSGEPYLHIPRPTARPGDAPDFSYLSLSAAGEIRYPDPCTPARDIAHLAEGLVRVLDVDGVPQGEWAPDLEPAELLEALRLMMLTRQMDHRMRQRQLPLG